MQIVFLVLLAVIALWALALFGWIIPLVAFVVFRKERFARVLGLVSAGWFVIAIAVGVATYPYAKSQISSIPRSISPEELEAFDDMHQIDRERYGLTAVDRQARVLLERRTGSDAQKCGYDAMLHMYSPSAERTVAFELENGKYKWVGEQEIHYSGRTFQTVDGEVLEAVFITYSTYERPGTAKGLRVDYMGPDESLMNKSNLTPEDVRPVIREWHDRH